MDVDKLTVPKLRAELKRRRLPTLGLKTALVKRLKEALACTAGVPPDLPVLPSASSPMRNANKLSLSVIESHDPENEFSNQPTRCEVRKQTLAVTSLHVDDVVESESIKLQLKRAIASGEWDEELMVKIYDTKLRGKIPNPSGRISNESRAIYQSLQTTRYLEYLWVNFSGVHSSDKHVFSILLLVNEKHFEKVCVWDYLQGFTSEKFNSLFRRILFPKQNFSSKNFERTARVKFLNHVFLSLEAEKIRAVVLPFVSLPLWSNLSKTRLQLELRNNRQLEKHWKYFMKKEAESMQRSGHISLKESPESAWLPALISEFFEILKCTTMNLKAGTLKEGEFDKAVTNIPAIYYCEQFIQLITDLLSQLPTRRFVRALFDDCKLLIKARLAAFHAHPAGQLYRQLINLFEIYQEFEINDHTGKPLTDEDIATSHSERLVHLQKLCFKEIKSLRCVALSHCGALEKRQVLIKHLANLDNKELYSLATEHLRLVDPDDPWASDPNFILEVLVSTFEKRVSQRRVINEMPLYPNEDLILDSKLLPTSTYAEEKCLALPKLSLQFLTLQDYLLRNFVLLRLEAAYEIRGDIFDALCRMGPYKNPATDSVAFSGWARMATTVVPGGLTVTEVKKPRVGEEKPASVTCEVTINLSNVCGSAQDEWDQIRAHDVVFLLAVEGCNEIDAEKLAPQQQGMGIETRSTVNMFGLQFVRGAEVIEVRNKSRKHQNISTCIASTIGKSAVKENGDHRTFTLSLDPAQYQVDALNKSRNPESDVYRKLNVFVRRKPKENNFKALLESIRDILNTECVIPEWLHDIFLGYGDPFAAQSSALPCRLHTVDFKDTFVDENHLRDSFPGFEIKLTESKSTEPLFCRVTFQTSAGSIHLKGKGEPCESKKLTDRSMGSKCAETGATLLVESYNPLDVCPDLNNQRSLTMNRVRFTPAQVEAISSGVQPGLTMVVGPPGTGKTDTAAQILHCLYCNEPNQRTLLITHSNAALNDLFQKLLMRDVPSRYLLRLGQGESDLDTDLDFSRAGRVNAMLIRRLELLREVEMLASCLGQPKDVAYTCETAGHFWLLHVLSRWEIFESDVAASKDPKFVSCSFPFTAFFSSVPQPLFSSKSLVDDMDRARACMRYIQNIFYELEECRPFELLKGNRDRSNYLLTKQAKVVAMTCTHAAIKYSEFIRLGFKYDNLVMEESAQIQDIQAFIPMLLQKNDNGHSRLKRVVLIGDHHQLPPVVKNSTLQNFCNMDQSLFTRLIRLGVPKIELNAQGRSRPVLSQLYNWRYLSLGDLPVTKRGEFELVNPGFSHETQFIDVDDYNGVGETQPTPHFFQNLGEAEYIVSVFQYMRLLGYPADKITIITTYRGQKHLIKDVVARRCATHPLFGNPLKITTVDEYQGQQNDYVLLSLVRSKSVGHIRDVRRLVVAVSRARLGLYIFGRKKLFEQCFELSPTFSHLFMFPTKLALVPTETYPPMRSISETVTPYVVDDALAMGLLVNQLALKWHREQNTGEPVKL